MKELEGSRTLGNIMIIAGVLVLFAITLFWFQSALATRGIDQKLFLVSTVDLNLPLPTRTSTPSLTPSFTATPNPTQIEQTNEPSTLLNQPTFKAKSTSAVKRAATKTSNLGSPKPEPKTPTPLLPISAGPAVQIVIPKIDINQVVVPVDLHADEKGQVDWNTDILFATHNRRDLVGQLGISANPGDGGNVILVGHNYNRGRFYREGVFVNLKRLKEGDKISVYTENGSEFRYEITLIKQVPWRTRDDNELQKHQKYLLPTKNEQLTLVTCGGANVWPWPARIYVVAQPTNR